MSAHHVHMCMLHVCTCKPMSVDESQVFSPIDLHIIIF